MLATIFVLYALAVGAFAVHEPHSFNVLKARQYKTSSPTCDLSPDLEEAYKYEQSNYVDGPAINSSFYTVLPANASKAAPGSLLKLESVSNASLYTLPPTTSLSRFIYQSETLDNKTVPVSAYILWPYNPRKQKDGKYPVVAFAHGAAGFTANCAPSNIRNLWQHYLAPYALAAQGYVVVGTDYAGLGVPKYPDGKPIIHSVFASPAAANDVVYSVQAAQKAFPLLSQEFVVMGQSQGGGAAWSVAQRMASRPVRGYLGTVALSPITRLLSETSAAAPILALAIAPSVKTFYPGFNISSVATPAGEAALDTIYACGGCNAIANPIIAASAPVKENWQSNPYYLKWQSRVVNGGKAIGGPLFVAHGTDDPLLDYSLTFSAVKETRYLFPKSQIQFVTVEGASHVPAMTASQPLWMSWIEARFAGVPLKQGDGFGDTVIGAARPAEGVSKELNWYIGIATEAYQVA